jgi:hypothetical protein
MLTTTGEKIASAEPSRVKERKGKKKKKKKKTSKSRSCTPVDAGDVERRTHLPQISTSARAKARRRNQGHTTCMSLHELDALSASHTSAHQPSYSSFTTLRRLQALRATSANH